MEQRVNSEVEIKVVFETHERPTLPNVSNGRSNPEVVGLIPTEVKRMFSLPCVIP